MKWYVHLLDTYMQLKISGKIEYKNGIQFVKIL